MKNIDFVALLLTIFVGLSIVTGAVVINKQRKEIAYLQYEIKEYERFEIDAYEEFAEMEAYFEALEIINNANEKLIDSGYFIDTDGGLHKSELLTRLVRLEEQLKTSSEADSVDYATLWEDVIMLVAVMEDYNELPSRPNIDYWLETNFPDLYDRLMTYDELYENSR